MHVTRTSHVILGASAQVFWMLSKSKKCALEGKMTSWRLSKNNASYRTKLYCHVYAIQWLESAVDTNRRQQLQPSETLSALIFWIIGTLDPPSAHFLHVYMKMKPVQGTISSDRDVICRVKTLSYLTKKPKMLAHVINKWRTCPTACTINYLRVTL